MELDVVAELALQRHVVGEHRDLVSTCTLGREERLVGPAEQIGGGVTAGHTQRDADADRAGEHLAVDGHPLAQHRLQPICQGFRLIGVHRRHRDDDELVAAEAGDQVGPFRPLAEPLREHPDEPVAGRMTQIVVDRLQPVQVEEQCGDGAGLSRPPIAGRGGPAGRGGC